MQRQALATLRKSEAYTLALDADWKYELTVNDDAALCIDSTYFGNVSKFLNHMYVLAMTCIS